MNSGRVRDLRDVRRENRRARIASEVRRFRVHHNWQPASPTLVDGEADHIWAERSLGVIREDDDIAGMKLAADLPLQRLFRLPIRGSRGFVIDTQQLLALRYETAPFREWSLRLQRQVRRSCRRCCPDSAKLSAGGVVADPADHNAACSQRRDVSGNVGCAPRRGDRLPCKKYRNRTFGRNAFDAALNEPIKHTSPMQSTLSRGSSAAKSSMSRPCGCISTNLLYWRCRLTGSFQLFVRSAEDLGGSDCMQSFFCANDDIVLPVGMPDRRRLIVSEQTHGGSLASGGKLQRAAIMADEQADRLQIGGGFRAAPVSRTGSMSIRARTVPFARRGRYPPSLPERREHGY